MAWPSALRKPSGGLHVFLDAVSASSGGGITHLANLLKHWKTPDSWNTPVLYVSKACPEMNGFEKFRVIRVGGLFRHLPILPQSSQGKSDTTVGLSLTGSLRFFRGASVVLNRTLLPFQVEERARYGWSIQRLRLSLLSVTQAWAIRRASVVVYLTNYARSVVEKSYPKAAAAEAMIVPHGSGWEARLNEWPDSPEILRLLISGQVDVYKHIPELVRHIDRGISQGLNCHLTMMGGCYPPAGRQLRSALAAVTNKEAFNWIGKVDRSHVARVYADHDVLIQLSTCETFGHPVVEAASNGLLIVAPPNSAASEIVGGHHARCESPSDLAVVLRDIFRRKQHFRRMRFRAADSISRLTWEAHVNGLVEAVDIASGRQRADS